jgi:hypothetical protein
MCDFDVGFDNLIEMVVSSGQFMPTAKEVLAEKENRLLQTADTLAKVIRPLVRRSKQLLFHGTRYPKQILKQNKLRCSNTETFSVHFSRDPVVATFFGLGEFEDGVGAVLVLDRDRLAQDYSLRCFRNPRLAKRADEADERVYRRDITRLDRYLHDTIWIDGKRRQIWSEKQVREEGSGKVVTWPTDRGWMSFNHDDVSSSQPPWVEAQTEDVGESAANDEMDAVLRLLTIEGVGCTGEPRSTGACGGQ